MVGYGKLFLINYSSPTNECLFPRKYSLFLSNALKKLPL